jgi:hypothetical protein
MEYKIGKDDSILVYSLMFCMYISKISTVVVVTVSLTILKGDVI